ncbi:GNAT family N-acetyltransferase [Pseudooceanicola aestuarii]|uniref:GNAT family N-acetyltransferase n=1 Tax=Pseudooceanicola aestuarii TaxID=2697319 RepID=UPI0013D5F2DB|nr:GNAT family N-acetyltransferase [Pseudooceanicola aestuarii]
MTALHLASEADFDTLLPLVRAFHEEFGIDLDDAGRQAALDPILSGSPLGVAYLIGPARAPIGYIVITFGWSIEFGGMDGFVDELFIRPGVRNRGIAGEVLSALPRALAGAGLRALHLEVRRDDTRAKRLYAKQKFAARDDYMLMTRRLS